MKSNVCVNFCCLILVCQLKFERKSIFTSERDFDVTSPFIADFNSDNQSDIGYITSPNSADSNDTNRYVLIRRINYL